MEEKGFSVFRSLDNPASFAGRPLWDVASFGIPFCIGIIARHVIFCTLIGIVLYHMKRKISRELPKHFLYGLFYWIMPPFFSKLTPSYKRFFLR